MSLLLRWLPSLTLVGFAGAAATALFRAVMTAEHQFSFSEASLLRIELVRSAFGAMYTREAVCGLVAAGAALAVVLVAFVALRRRDKTSAAIAMDLGFGAALVAAAFAWRAWCHATAWRAVEDVDAAVAAMSRTSLSFAGVAAGTALVVVALALGRRAPETKRSTTAAVAVAALSVAAVYVVDHSVDKKLASMVQWFMAPPWASQPSLQPARAFSGDIAPARLAPAVLSASGIELGEDEGAADAAGNNVGRSGAHTVITGCDAQALEARGRIGRALLDSRAGASTLRCFVGTVLRFGTDADRRRPVALIGVRPGAVLRVDAGDAALSQALATAASRAIGVLPCEVTHDEVKAVLRQMNGTPPVPFDANAPDATFHARPGVTSWAVRVSEDATTGARTIDVDIPTTPSAPLALPADAGTRGCLVIDDDTTGDALLAAASQLAAAGLDVRLR